MQKSSVTSQYAFFVNTFIKERKKNKGITKLNKKYFTSIKYVNIYAIVVPYTL